MARMEFLNANVINTTTMVVASTGTGTFSNLYDRNDSLAYATVGHTTDTSTILSIEFLGPEVLSHIILKNHNLRIFRAFYNSATANTFSTDINQTTNSQTSSYFSFNSITVSSVQLQMDGQINADTEKRVGELITTNRRLQFPVNPAHNNFRPSINRTKIVHTMPDGGKTIFNIQNKFKATIDLDFITAAFHSDLSAIYDEADPLYFLPYPTTGTDWDGGAYETVWTNDLNFKFADNSKTQGFSGKIILEETPSA